jgi:DNA recombination protein RmuC
MELTNFLLIASVILNLLIIVILVVYLAKKQHPEMNGEMRILRQELSNSFGNLGNSLVGGQNQFSELTGERIGDLINNMNNAQTVLNKNVLEMSNANERRFAEFLTANEIRLEAVRSTVDQRLRAIQEDNEKQLDKMRQTVDEKLQKTLESRIGESFRLVSERLEQVYTGLGEMQTLATGVGDLKKVLANVKTRGIMGEIQLGAILEQILSNEQYDENVVTKKGSGFPVEYAIKMPGDDKTYVYLPIDSKFPLDAYSTLVDAYETADKDQIDAAVKLLKQRIKTFAKDIRDKYIYPPYTTDFAIMFLPYEGLYAEVIRYGMVESLSNEYKIMIAGPTTMAALLNSLQMGFKTLAIQKRSGEVWNVLSAVKTEFDKFGEVLKSTQNRLEQANSELDKLVGVRTRAIQSRLKKLDKIPDQDALMLLVDDSLEVEE